MMAYASEGEKGRFIAIFWAIFNAGAVIGGLVPLIQNVQSTQASVGNATYIGFLALTALGSLSALALCRTERVRRPDGTGIDRVDQPSVVDEVVGVWRVLRDDTYVVLLFPLFFSSNIFYTYQFNVSLQGPLLIFLTDRPGC
jgi:hypothetical protein